MPSFLADLKDLQSIKVSRGVIDKLPPELYSLKKLKKLHLTFKVFPQHLDRFSKLEELTVRHANETNFKNIAKATSLKKIFLTKSNLVSVGDEIKNLKNLEELHIEFAKLKHISENIRYLKNLKKLTLSFQDDLQKIPDSVGELKKLEALWLPNTKISILPKSVCNLTILKSLNISGTQISSLPQEFSNLKNLAELHIRNTKIKKIPEAVFNLPKLEKIYLDNIDPEGVKRLRAKGVKVNNE